MQRKRSSASGGFTLRSFWADMRQSASGNVACLSLHRSRGKFVQNLYLLAEFPQSVAVNELGLKLAEWNSPSTEAFGQNPDPSMDPNVLQREIANKIKVNLFWAAFDFGFGEILLWTALLSSIVSAALVTLDVGQTPRWAFAVLSGLLPFVLLTERVFRFTERCQWHQTYVTELQQLSHQIRDQGLDAPTVSKALDELNIRKQKEFPQRNPMALQSSK
jgi:hypothetical protein